MVDLVLALALLLLLLLLVLVVVGAVFPLLDDANVSPFVPVGITDDDDDDEGNNSGADDVIDDDVGVGVDDVANKRAAKVASFALR